MQTILDTNAMILRMTMARDSMLSTKLWNTGGGWKRPPVLELRDIMRSAAGILLFLIEFLWNWSISIRWI